MRLRPSHALAAFLCTSVLGCNLLTGVGNLTFTNAGTGEGGADGSVDFFDGGGPPSGTLVVASSDLFLEGVTSDGYAIYFDDSSGELNAVEVELPDGGPVLPSPSPVTLGPADYFRSSVDGLLVEFFAPAGEVDAGPSHVGSLSVWSSSLSGPSVISSGVLAPDFTNGFETLAASADGQYVAYFGAVDPSGVSGTIFVANTGTGETKKLVGPVDVVEDACEPGLFFGGPYVVASYCSVPAGGRVDPALPDGGTNYRLATVSAFLASTGEASTLATKVLSSIAVDSLGTAAVMDNDNGLVAAHIPGDGGVVPIDPTGTYWILSSDGKTVDYSTTASTLKTASTTAPVDPIVLSTGATPFPVLYSESFDGNWAIGGASYLTASGTNAIYVASADSAGPVTTIASGSPSTIIAGLPFTTDSKYALFATGYASLAGTLTAYALGSGGAPIVLGSDTAWAQAGTGSQVVFNVGYGRDPNDTADLMWRDLAVSGAAPTLLVSQADALFYVSPARDKVVYTYSHGGASDGLWVLDTSAIPSIPGCSPEVVHLPAGLPGSCTQTEIQTYDDDCVSASAPAGACDTVADDISSDCYACLVSDETDQAWSVVVNYDAQGISVLDNGGCFLALAAAGGANAAADLACGEAIEAQAECESAACTTQTDTSTFDPCETNADSTVCLCYITSATKACASLSSSVCNPGNDTTFEQGFLAIAPVMCR